MGMDSAIVKRMVNMLAFMIRARAGFVLMEKILGVLDEFSFYLFE
jgi:hypothetical protein